MVVDLFIVWVLDRIMWYVWPPYVSKGCPQNGTELWKLIYVLKKTLLFTLPLRKQQLLRPITMNAGKGPSSYAQNSSTQRASIDHAKQLIEEIIATKLDIKKLASTSTNGMFCIADFGCGTGSNSPKAMGVIIEAISKNKTSQEGLTIPSDFLIFFSDVSSNDFKNLFASLPPKRNYCAAVLPGDFTQRLLPKSSLQFGYSCLAVHWLTQLPKELTDPNSLAWNKGEIYCTMGDNRIHTAYLDQFTKNIETFLEARAHEMVCGGMIILILPIATFSNMPAFIHILNLSLKDMINKGRINQAQLDVFNIPYYFATLEELKAVMENCSESFSIEKLETISTIEQYLYALPINAITGAIRAVHESMLMDHFGSEIMDELFDTFEALLTTRNKDADERGKTAMIILKRNTDY